jgi:uncharacterized protein YcnI
MSSLSTIRLRGYLAAAALAIGSAWVGAASAHVSMWPRESRAGMTERYTVRVPIEGKVATTKAEMMVPEGVTVGLVGAAGSTWKHEIKRENDRIVGVTWHVNIPPGEFMEFVFLARNPKDKTEIVWSLRQTFADGTSEDWTKAPDGKIRPTATTKLVSGAP